MPPDSTSGAATKRSFAEYSETAATPTFNDIAIAIYEQRIARTSWTWTQIAKHVTEEFGLDNSTKSKKPISNADCRKRLDQHAEAIAASRGEPYRREEHFRANYLRYGVSDSVINEAIYDIRMAPAPITWQNVTDAVNKKFGLDGSEGRKDLSKESVQRRFRINAVKIAVRRGHLNAGSKNSNIDGGQANVGEESSDEGVGLGMKIGQYARNFLASAQRADSVRQTSTPAQPSSLYTKATAPRGFPTLASETDGNAMRRAGPVSQTARCSGSLTAIAASLEGGDPGSPVGDAILHADPEVVMLDASPAAILSSTTEGVRDKSGTSSQANADPAQPFIVDAKERVVLEALKKVNARFWNMLANYANFMLPVYDRLTENDAQATYASIDPSQRPSKISSKEFVVYEAYAKASSECWSWVVELVNFKLDEDDCMTYQEFTSIYARLGPEDSLSGA